MSNNENKNPNLSAVGVGMPPPIVSKTFDGTTLSEADLARAFATAPSVTNADGVDCQACVFVCGGGASFDDLAERDWVVRQPSKMSDHRKIRDPREKNEQVTRYIKAQCEYPVLSAIDVGDVTGEGVLLTKFFPSPSMKSLLLSLAVTRKVRAVVFSAVSRSYGFFFSAEDRNMLVDLDSFGICVYYFSAESKALYQFTRRVDCDVGMFVPTKRRDEYLRATFLGVYGSNLVAGDLEAELETLLMGLLELRKTCGHELLNPGRPLAVVTGGGPGAMEVGNRVAKRLGILSCGMIVDFGSLTRKPGATINEQKQNQFVEAFMTYRPEKIVERQADFHLDIPIFLTGGIGTDFEYALEEVRRKVCTTPPNPMILFGDTWPSKITHRFQTNLAAGVIKGSEWIANVPFVVEGGMQALKVLTSFFEGTLPVGPKHPSNDLGYVNVQGWVL
jgi:predicted Rossmann-fold nucleotide-binding protein